MRTHRTMFAGGLALALACVGAPLASATNDPTNDIAGLVADAAPTQAQVVTGRSTPAGLAVEAAGKTTTLPKSTTAPIELRSKEANGPRLSVSLPAEAQLAPGRMAADGMMVYNASRGSVAAAAQTLDDGSLRLQTISTKRTDGPQKFTYQFGQGVEPRLNDDGSADLVQPFAGGEVTLGKAATPWAVDAAGRGVSTWYEVDGDALVQVVVPDEKTVFPVVADPSVSLGWHIYVKFNKSETKRIGTSSITSKAKYVAVICAVIPFAPAATACGLVAYDIYSSVASTFKSGAKVGKCVQLGYTYLPALWMTSWKVVSC